MIIENINASGEKLQLSVFIDSPTVHYKRDIISNIEEIEDAADKLRLVVKEYMNTLMATELEIGGEILTENSPEAFTREKQKRLLGFANNIYSSLNYYFGIVEVELRECNLADSFNLSVEKEKRDIDELLEKLVDGTDEVSTINTISQKLGKFHKSLREVFDKHNEFLTIFNKIINSPIDIDLDFFISKEGNYEYKCNLSLQSGENESEYHTMKEFEEMFKKELSVHLDKEILIARKTKDTYKDLLRSNGSDLEDLLSKTNIVNFIYLRGILEEYWNTYVNDKTKLSHYFLKINGFYKKQEVFINETLVKLENNLLEIINSIETIPKEELMFNYSSLSILRKDFKESKEFKEGSYNLKILNEIDPELVKLCEKEILIESLSDTKGALIESFPLKNDSNIVTVAQTKNGSSLSPENLAESLNIKNLKQIALKNINVKLELENYKIRENINHQILRVS